VSLCYIAGLIVWFAMSKRRGSVTKFHTGPRVPLDFYSSLKEVQISLKDVHSWTFIARARVRARVRVRARA